MSEIAPLFTAGGKQSISLAVYPSLFSFSRSVLIQFLLLQHTFFHIEKCWPSFLLQHCFSSLMFIYAEFSCGFLLQIYIQGLILALMSERVHSTVFWPVCIKKDASLACVGNTESRNIWQVKGLFLFSPCSVESMQNTAQCSLKATSLFFLGILNRKRLQMLSRGLNHRWTQSGHFVESECRKAC